MELNIAASSGGVRIQKKKKTNFRAKRTARKTAKAKARDAPPSSTATATTTATTKVAGSSNTNASAVQIRATKPPPQQRTQQSSYSKKSSDAAQQQPSRDAKKPGVVSFTKQYKRPIVKAEEPVATSDDDGDVDAKQETSKTVEAAESKSDSDDDDDDDDDEPEMVAAEESDDEMAAIIKRSIATTAAQEAQHKEQDSANKAAEATEGGADGAIGEDGEEKKWSRKNPNKAAYVAEAFTTVRTAITNVLDKPLESMSSEKIFAHTTFESMNLHKRLIDILQKDSSTGHGFGFARPTTVQVKTIPLVLAGKDVLVKSETGSGKTLSYLLPIVQKLQSIEPRVGRADGCMALILAPTRELCQQIQETAEKLTKAFVFLVPGMVVGGEKKKTEKARLRKGITILIATPGRLADHLVNTQSFNYARLQFLVLDEADRLLDMGFQKQITQILQIIDASTKNNKYTGGRRQNLLVSATINSGVQELAKMSLHKPVLVDADKEAAKNGHQDSAMTAAAASASLATPGAPQQEKFNTPVQLQQHFMIVPAKTRLCALTCFLRQELNNSVDSANARKKCKIVVFMSTCDAVDFHFALFQKCSWPVGRNSKTPAVEAEDANAKKLGAASPLFGAHGPLFRLHGNIPQKERTSTFKDFCSSSHGVLICTDVAARGLNLPTVQWIVQYDPPTETRDYVHRVGRTARSGNTGSSLLFLMPSESEYLDYLKKHNLALNALSLEKTISRVAAGGGFMFSRKKLLHEVVQSDLQFLFEQTLLGDKDLFELSCQGFHSFVRSYATHSSDTRGIFHVRGLHFGHIAKSFALREPPASTKLRDSVKNATKGTLHKRKERDDKEKFVANKKVRQDRQDRRKFNHHVSEFAG